MSGETLTPEIALRWLDEGAPSYEEIKRRFGLYDFARSPESLDEAAVERHFSARLEKLRPPGDLDTPEGLALLAAWMSELRARESYIEQIGFAVPCREAISTIATSPRLLEVGAGTGFWSALLARAGADVVATDIRAGGHEGWQGRYHPTKQLGAVAAVQAFPDRDVLVCWPTLRAPWARRMAEAMQPGRVLHVIAEESCAEAGFFAVLRERFEMLDRVTIPTWEFMHDDLRVFRKRPVDQQRRAPTRERRRRRSRQDADAATSAMADPGTTIEGVPGLFGHWVTPLADHWIRAGCLSTQPRTTPCRCRLVPALEPTASGVQAFVP